MRRAPTRSARWSLLPARWSLPSSCLLWLALAVPAWSAEATRFAVRAVELHGIVARVTITVTEDQSAVEWLASDAARQAYRFEIDHDTLCIAPRQAVVGGGTFASGGVTVTQSGSNNSVAVTIGGPGAAVTASSAPLPPLELRVPRHLPLKITAAGGSWQIGDTDGPLALSLAAGAARIGRVRSAQLLIQGSGTLHAARVDDALVASVNGSGEVRVATSRLETLDATVAGSGTIQVGGVARVARVAIQGVGTVALERAIERPWVQVDGVGTVRIGGW